MSPKNLKCTNIYVFISLQIPSLRNEQLLNITINVITCLLFREKGREKSTDNGNSFKKCTPNIEEEKKYIQMTYSC